MHPLCDFLHTEGSQDYFYNSRDTGNDDTGCENGQDRDRECYREEESAEIDEQQVTRREKGVMSWDQNTGHYRGTPYPYAPYAPCWAACI